jgi:hypothetical protein
MSTSDIVTRMLEIDGFGWQCGEPLKDKGSYFRCSCGCSQPDKDWDGSMTIKQPMILRDAADEIIRLRAERDEARRDAERWQVDALRLLQEKNDALKQRDAARRQCCTEAVQRPFGSGTIHNCGDAVEEATRRGWDCFGPIKP